MLSLPLFTDSAVVFAQTSDSEIVEEDTEEDTEEDIEEDTEEDIEEDQGDTEPGE